MRADRAIFAQLEQIPTCLSGLPAAGMLSLPPPAGQDPQPSGTSIDGSATKSDRHAIERPVACLTCIDTTEKLHRALAAASKLGPDAIIMLGEWDLTLEDVLPEMDRLRAFCKSHRATIVAAVGDGHRPRAWGPASELLTARGVVCERAVAPRECTDSIGLYVDGNLAYAFPKTVGGATVVPLHVIPGRRIGVTICGEIHDLPGRAAGSDGQVDLILNPRREGDDPELPYRMMARFENASRERLRDEVAKEFAYRITAGMEAEKRLAVEQAIERRTSEVLKIVGNGFDSYYLRNTPSELKRTVPFIRSDVDASGLMNQAEGASAREVRYSKSADDVYVCTFRLRYLSSEK